MESVITLYFFMELQKPSKKMTASQVKLVERFVELWIEKNKEDYELFMVAVEAKRRQLADPEFAKTQDKQANRRLVGTMPPDLNNRLRAYWMKKFNQSDFPVEDFLTLFPQFKLSEKL